MGKLPDLHRRKTLQEEELQAAKFHLEKPKFRFLFGDEIDKQVSV